MLKVCNRIAGIVTRILKDQNFRLLLLIIMVGGILRFYGIHNAENTDEYNEVFEALRVASGRFNLERWHKKGFQNILAIEYGIYYVMGHLVNIFGTPSDFAEKIVRNMEPLFLIGRYTVATMGTASIGLIYAIGKRLYDRRTATIASAFLAVLPLHVWTSHLVNTDVPLTFFFLLAFYFVCRLVDTGKNNDYVLAAFLSAITINMKIIGFGIVILFICGHIMRCRKERQPVFKFFCSKRVYYSVIAFVAGLVLSNPPIIIGLHKLIAYHLGVYTNAYDEVPYAIMNSGYLSYLILLYQVLGFPLFVLILVALVRAICSRSSWDYSLIIFVGTVFLVLGRTKFLVQDRYLMTLLVGLLLLGARSLATAATHVFGSRRNQIIFVLVVSLFVLVVPFIRSVAYVRTLTEQNTSVISKRWIESHIPSGSKLLIDAGRTIITSGPRLNQSRAQLEQKLNIIRDLKPGQTFDSPLVRIVDSYAAVYFELLLKNMPDITYDITTTELGTNVESPEYYEKNDFDYFIHDKGLADWKLGDRLWTAKYPKSANFYSSFDKQFQLVKAFEPSATRSGSTIMIYRIPKR